MTTSSLRSVPLLLALAVLALLTALWGRPREPRSCSKSLSYCLEHCLPATTRGSSMWFEERQPCPEPVRAALAEMGPSAVPHLLGKLTNQPPRLRRLTANLANRIHATLPPPPRADFLLRNRVVHALAAIGPPGVPRLTAALGHPASVIRLSGLRALRFIGPDADSATPHILLLLDDPNEEIQATALAALHQMGPNKRGALPMLMRKLHDCAKTDICQGAALVLGGIGPDAQSAVPLLEKLMRDKDCYTSVREQAAVALWRIARDTNAMSFLLTKLRDCRLEWSQDPNQPLNFETDDLQQPGEQAGVFIFSNRGSPSGPNDFPACLRILASLGEMGPSAKPAVPVLLELEKDPAFYPGLECLRPKLESALRKALCQIDPETAASLNRAR